MDQVIQKAKSAVLKAFQSISQPRQVSNAGLFSQQMVSAQPWNTAGKQITPVQAVAKSYINDFSKTLGNIGLAGSSLVQASLQPFANQRSNNMLKSLDIAKKAAQASGNEKQLLLQQSRSLSNQPNISGILSQNLAEINLAGRQKMGMEGTGIKTFLKGAAPAANIALTGKGGQALGAMSLAQKATTLGVGGLLSGGMGAISGQNPLQAAAAGVLKTPRLVGLTGITAPIIKYGASGIMDKFGTPLARNIVGRGLTGFGNVLEDEFISKLDGYKPGLADRVLSFGIGALLAPTKEYEEFIQSGNPKIKDIIRDFRGRFAKDAGVNPKSLDYMVEDPNTRQMVLRSKLDEKIPGVMSDLEKLNKYLEQKTNGFGNVAKSIRDEKGGVLPEYKGLIPEATQPQIKLAPEVPLGQKERKFITSVKEAPNVANPVKLKVKGTYTPKPNTQLMGEAQALLQDGASINFKQVKNVDQKVAATIQEAINQQKAGNHEAAANLFNNLSEQGTELGRGVQAFSLLKNMSPESIALSVSGRIKKYNQTAKIKIPELTGEQSKLIAEKMQEADLLKGREKNIALNELNNTINSFIPSSLADKALTVWKAGLLTSLRTHERNFVGNTIHGVLETAKDVPGSLADIALSKVTGKRTLTPTIKGLGEFGSKSTAQQMKDLVSKGYDPSSQINKFDHKQINWGKGLGERILKKYTDIVFRSLGAADKPFYNAAYARSLYNQAGAEAINAGKRGNTKFIENLVKNPTELMLKNAISDANVATFKDKNIATNTVNALKRGMGEGWGKVVGEVTMPFTGVPSSILGQISAYSPLGLIKGISTAGKVALNNLPELQRQAAQEIGRGVMGSGIFALGAYLMGKGLISGQPKDATEAKQWELENKPRNSILIGGKWRSLNSIGPESVVFLAGSKLNQEMNDPEGSLSNYAVKLGKDYLDQSFVQGLQGPINAITDPNRYAKSYVGQLLSSPIPNIIKDVAKATDKSARESNTAFDYFKQGIPGEVLGLGRKSLVEKRDVLGNVIPQEPTGLAAFVDLFNSKTPVVNSVVNELSRLNSVGENATPSKLSSSQTILKQKVKLTFDELNKLEKGAGEAVTFALNELISDPNYQSLTDEEKSQAIDKVVTSTRTKYKNLNAGEITLSVNAPQTQAPQSGKTYSYVDELGNYKQIDLSPIVKPQATGQAELDKKLFSSYNSKITAQISAITKLYENGQVTAGEAEGLIKQLRTTALKTSKKGKNPKKIAVKKITLKKISMPKVKQIKLKAFKIPKAKTVKLAKIKSSKMLKLKTIKYRA